PRGGRCCTPRRPSTATSPARGARPGAGAGQTGGPSRRRSALKCTHSHASAPVIGRAGLWSSSPDSVASPAPSSLVLVVLVVRHTVTHSPDRKRRQRPDGPEFISPFCTEYAGQPRRVRRGKVPTSLLAARVLTFARLTHTPRRPRQQTRRAGTTRDQLREWEG